MEIPALQPHVSAAGLPPERLANNSALSEQEKIVEASRQFEAILLRQILDSTQKTVIPSTFADNSASASIYRDMITNHLAESISKSGAFGLAQMFEHQLSRPATPTTEAGSGISPGALPTTRADVSADRPPLNASEPAVPSARHLVPPSTKPQAGKFRSLNRQGRDSSPYYPCDPRDPW